MSAAIELTNVGKRYIKYDDTPMLVTALKWKNKTQRSHIWAVKGVDLEVQTGECVGVIGRNGSGKSTLLQMVAGTTRPSEGLVRTRGRIAPLISVGVGFHPELTGRENVYVNGMILGMDRAYLDRVFDSIVAFSEVEDFINTPVKFYSSGMLVRLGFSVAIHVEPEILLVDEVLAVGDLRFQLKCFDRMNEIRQSGATILVVSHNLNAVRQLCSRTALLHDSKQIFNGDTEEAISRFHEVIGEPREIDGGTSAAEAAGWELGAAEIETITLLGPDGEPTNNMTPNEPMTACLDVRFDKTVENPIFGLAIHTESGVPRVHRQLARADQAHVPGGIARATVDIRLRTVLAKGSYRMTTGMFKGDMTTRLARAHPVLFYVGRRGNSGGIADLQAEFEVLETPAANTASNGRPSSSAPATTNR